MGRVYTVYCSGDTEKDRLLAEDAATHQYPAEKFKLVARIAHAPSARTMEIECEDEDAGKIGDPEVLARIGAATVLLYQRL